MLLDHRVLRNQCGWLLTKPFIRHIGRIISQIAFWKGGQDPTLLQEDALDAVKCLNEAA
jgi:hypothetical protein